MTNCPNCGAVRDPAETACPYCDTPYSWDIAMADAGDMSARVALLTHQIQAGFMTPNEARERLGLPPV